VYKIQEKGKPEAAIWLREYPIIISNDGNGDLLFDATSPDSSKIKIHFENERPYLADMTFNQPIFINGQAIPPGSKRALKHADMIQIGNTTFEISDPKRAIDKLTNGSSSDSDKHWRLQATGNWLDGQIFTLKGKTVIGRDSSCTITIPGSHLSRRHAEFLAVGTKLIMKDLDSSNGSFVNGKRCKEANLVDGDEIRLDVLNFKILAPNDKNLSLDKRKTVQSDAIKEDSTEKPKEGDRNWVTKPTSIGNTSHDPHDLLLAQHIRQKRITYTIFGVLFAILAVLAVVIL
jgi:pSer/pThr/pTyr-binding forkhead associated (FHA) protein